MKYDLTVSIVTYNTETEVLLKVLKCLSTIKLNIKIFISDNSETDYLKEIIDKLNDEKIIYIFNNFNGGFGAGNNVVIDKILKKEIHSDYHLIMNSDIYFEEGTVEKIVSYMNKNVDIGQIGPKIREPEGKLSYSCRLLPTPVDLIVRRFIPFKVVKKKIDFNYEMKWYNYKDITEVPILSGCFMFIRNEALQKTGKFDERYFMYMEDYDLCRRIGENYKVVYYPEAEIVHEHGRASYKSLKLLGSHINSAIKYFNKWGWIFDKKRKKINNEVMRRIKYR